MQLELYQVDAFASQVFSGNPAAICPLQAWLPDALMQSIASENNLSETAFFVKTGHGYHIRWFTPRREVKLCGHATLASAHVIFNMLDDQSEQISFDSRSGELIVRRDGDWLEMDFPSQPPQACPTPAAISKAFSDTPLECLAAEDYVVLFDDETKILEATPDFIALQQLDLRGVIITAASREFDFVCRFFAPKYGLNEDPVTGSAFTQLIPYWTEKLGKPTLHAKQVSQRGGEVRCAQAGERVKIAGKAVSYLKGTINLAGVFG